MTKSTAVSVIALKTFPLFQGLSDEVLGNVARVSMMRRIARGQSVVNAGDRSDYVYFVLTGSLKVIVSDEDGREVILSILGQANCSAKWVCSTSSRARRRWWPSCLRIWC